MGCVPEIGYDCMANGACSLTLYCGDGLISTALQEECDDGNTLPRDGCSTKCVYCTLPQVPYPYAHILYNAFNGLVSRACVTRLARSACPQGAHAAITAHSVCSCVSSFFAYAFGILHNRSRILSAVRRTCSVLAFFAELFVQCLSMCPQNCLPVQLRLKPLFGQTQPNHTA